MLEATSRPKNGRNPTNESKNSAVDAKSDLKEKLLPVWHADFFNQFKQIDAEPRDSPATTAAAESKTK